MISVYLSGACANVSKTEREGWRAYIESALASSQMGIRAFNPNKHFTYEDDPQDEKMVMDFFLSMVERCDVFVVNLDNSALSVGTGMEFDRALATSKFIIGFGEYNVYPYLRERCSVILKDKDSVVDFLLDHYIQYDWR